MKCITKMANEYLKNKRTKPMTAEQLEELLKDAYTPGYRNRFRELQNMAPSLARRVIAAESENDRLREILKENGIAQN